jgi:adenylate cyclase
MAVISQLSQNHACQNTSRIWPVHEYRVAAILFADVAGYARMMSLDESATHSQYKAHRRELIDLKIAEHGGRIVKSTGDGLLAVFKRAHEAVLCAIQVQQGMSERNKVEPRYRRIMFRIGINYGKIIVEPDDVYGTEANVAARLQSIAPAGGIAMSAAIAQIISGVVKLDLEDFGLRRLKNMTRAVHVFRYSAC